MGVATAPPTAMDASPAVRGAGLVCFVAGLLGAASGVFLMLIEPQVPDSRFSYPLTSTAFVVIQVWFVVQHLGLLAGQVGLWVSGAAGRSRTSTVGHVVALAGMVLLTVTELAATGAAEDPYPSATTDVLDVLYGVACIAIGVGLATVGVAVVRQRSWVGWRRWVVLALGVWVFVPMTPAILAGFVPARMGITGWMLLYAALGWAVAVPRSRAAEGTAAA